MALSSRRRLTRPIHNSTSDHGCAHFVSRMLLRIVLVLFLRGDRQHTYKPSSGGPSTIKKPDSSCVQLQLSSSLCEACTGATTSLAPPIVLMGARVLAASRHVKDSAWASKILFEA